MLHAKAGEQLSQQQGVVMASQVSERVRQFAA
jgi:hypothetical protein